MLQITTASSSPAVTLIPIHRICHGPRSAPSDLINCASTDSMGLARQLDHRSDLDGCEAVVICELDDDGMIVRSASAKRTAEGFVVANPFLGMQEGRLNVCFRDFTIWPGTCVIYDNSGSRRGRSANHVLEGDICEIAVKFGVVSVIVFGDDITPDLSN